MDSNRARQRLEVSNARLQHRVNKWGARVIPAILIGLVGYSVWVIVVLLGVNYLLKPASGAPRRIAAGIAIIVVYFVLFLPMAVSYLRVLQVVATNPGYVPRPNYKGSRRKHRRSRYNTDNTEKTYGETPSQSVGYLDRGSVSNGRNGPPPGLERFYRRDIFECEVDGMPRWCSTCQNWKPDRTHHSSEIGRCVYKMDHFCPWAGGIVSETSFKFFIQFLVYGAVWNLFVLIVSAYFTAEARRETGLDNINWIVAIALSGLFFLFAAGMAHTSLLAIYKNSTTVDNLAYRTRTHHFAVLIPPALTNPPQQSQPLPEMPNLIYPHEQPETATQTGPQTPPQPSNFTSPPPRLYPTITYPLPSSPSHPSAPPRTFAILTTPTGSNPYQLHSSFSNFKTVMGNTVWDWLLPFRYSPCYDDGHKKWFDYSNDNTERAGRGGSDRKYMYQFGPVVQEMVREAGLEMPRTRSEE